VSDKDIDGVMAMLPKDARYYFTKADNQRAIPETDVRQTALRHGLDGECFPNVETAYQSALKQAQPDDFIFVGGSSYVVADFLKKRF